MAMVLTSTAHHHRCDEQLPHPVHACPCSTSAARSSRWTTCPTFCKQAAWALPLTPAAALVRGLVTEDLSLWMLAWTAELVAYTVIPLFLASHFMRKRLIKLGLAATPDLFLLTACKSGERLVY